MAQAFSKRASGPLDLAPVHLKQEILRMWVGDPHPCREPQVCSLGLEMSLALSRAVH